MILNKKSDNCYGGLILINYFDISTSINTNNVIGINKKHHNLL